MSEGRPENEVKPQSNKQGDAAARQMGRMGDRDSEDLALINHSAIDTTLIANAMRRLGEKQTAKTVAERARAEALAAVKVEKIDVARVAAELEIPLKDAEVLLKEAVGDVGACFRKVIGLP